MTTGPPPPEDRLNEATEHLYQCAVTNFRLDVFLALALKLKRIEDQLDRELPAVRGYLERLLDPDGTASLAFPLMSDPDLPAIRSGMKKRGRPRKEDDALRDRRMTCHSPTGVHHVRISSSGWRSSPSRPSSSRSCSRSMRSNSSCTSLMATYLGGLVEVVLYWIFSYLGWPPIIAIAWGAAISLYCLATKLYERLREQQG